MHANKRLRILFGVEGYKNHRIRDKVMYFLVKTVHLVEL
jgi:hypothetical protein